MNKLKIFTIRDDKLETYNQPFFVPTIGAAERDFTDHANQTDSPLSKHPEDYTLFLLGEYDQLSGSMDLEPTPKALMKAIEVKNA
jgi:poly-D-alanine transfer protein DltD